MNYIHQLQRDLAAAQAEIHALRGGIQYLRGHLSAKKFYEVTTIQVSDVDLRCIEILHAGTDAAHEVHQQFEAAVSEREA